MGVEYIGLLLCDATGSVPGSNPKILNYSLHLYVCMYIYIFTSQKWYLTTEVKIVSKNCY